MCGIVGIILKQPVDFDLKEKIKQMSETIAHRGPDGEGFLLSNEQNTYPFFNVLSSNYTRNDLPFIPSQHLSNSPSNSFLAFGHRRLSIIDLSETGHQPMCTIDSNLWITYNGEIYNYVELKNELKTLGHTFFTESDTEVILNAYKQWGQNCVAKFNGMWAFCIYDVSKQLCFASRDRFGVKPFYYINYSTFFSFASEQKAFIKSGLIPTKINKKALHNFLVNDFIENETDNFFEGITELFPGNNLVFDLKTKQISITNYYNLQNHINLRNDNLNENELIEKINFTFENAVKLRLRSDVEVGTCLSGGIDSSALAVTMAQFTNKPVHCFTAIFKNESINEETFADNVSQKINGKHFKVEPTFDGFLNEVNDLIYSQDVPIWSTSTYAQHKVMQLAQQHNIKVVLDGQGADELFAGYHHHYLAMWNNLISNHKYGTAFKEIKAAKKTIQNPFQFFVKELIKQKHNFNKNILKQVLNSDFINSEPLKNQSVYFNDVNKQLANDIYVTRLKSFLKCEDRCGMWHSVESRTPFADDVELINLLFSFNGNKKIKNGVSKYLLREALKTKLPSQIYNRYDKKGFETPMNKWMVQLFPQLISEVKAAKFDFVNYSLIEKMNISNQSQNKVLFKLFVLARWEKVF
ncbi:MAG: asparagine synthase (glutamine-hydrolyzing) [Bacteroidota bacterium]|nr:asparagine synthase (glutamine-hydrolyzing) [Bacteroidota bacterium]